MSLTVHDEARRFHGETLNAQMLRAVDQRERRLAKAKQEDLASQDNHELRRRGGYDAGIRNRSSLRDTFTMTEEMTHHLEKGTRNEKFATCAMSGPHHPLEYRVAGVHRQVRYYQQPVVLGFGIFISILHTDFLTFTHKPISLVLSVNQSKVSYITMPGTVISQ